MIRTDASGRTLWVSQELVDRVCGISEAYFRKVRVVYKMTVQPQYQHHSFLTDSGKSWRWAHVNGRFFYDLKRIPNKAPQLYRDRFPLEAEIIDQLNKSEVGMEQDQSKVAADRVKAIVKAYASRSDVDYYRYEAPKTYSLMTAEDLAESLAWLRMMREYYIDDRTLEIGIKNKGQYLDICTDILLKKKLKGLRVASPAYLRRKVVGLPADISLQRQYLLHSNIGNHNATKVGRNKLVDQDTGEVQAYDLHEAMIYYLYMNPGSPVKLSKSQMYKRYMESCRDFRVEPVAERTFCHQVSRWPSRIKMDRSRYGIDYYRKHVLTYVPGDKLKYAHSLFAADGSATIAYHYYDNKGVCRRMNLYVITVTDVSSKFIAGWAPADIGTHAETPKMVMKSVQMAVENGGNQTMFELVTDNHGAFTSAESKAFLTSVFNRVRTIVPGNSQANDAETHFRLLKQSLRQCDNFIRTSFSGGIEGQANPDNIVRNEDLPTYQEVIEQFAQMVVDWNNSAMPNGCTPAEMFDLKHPDCQPIDDRLRRYLFGGKTKIDISDGRGFVNVTKVVLGRKTLNRYEIPDYEGAGIERISRAVGHTSQLPVLVCFDDEAADLYTLEGEYIMTCQRAALAGKSEAEKTDDHRQAESHHIERKGKALKVAASFEESVLSVKQLIDSGSAIDPSNLDPYALRLTDTSLRHPKEEINAEYETCIIPDYQAEKESAPRMSRKDPRQDAIDQI